MPEAAAAPSGPSAAALSTGPTVHPAVVRIVAAERSGFSAGSGALIDVRGPCGLVLTNWHVVRESTGLVEVFFPDGFRSAARVLKIDRTWDLAALLIWRPNTGPIGLAERAPQPGDPLTIAGYGPGIYRAVTGHCTQYVAPAMRQPREMVELNVAARQGDSGGPILNAEGQLAGVLFGSGAGTTTGTYSGRVAEFLSSLAPDIGRPLEDVLVRDEPPDAEAAALPADRPSPAVLAACTTPDERIDRLPAPPATNPAMLASAMHTKSAATVEWPDLAGRTFFERIKTLLAAVGGLSILWGAARRATG